MYLMHSVSGCEGLATQAVEKMGSPKRRPSGMKTTGWETISCFRKVAYEELVRLEIHKLGGKSVQR